MSRSRRSILKALLGGLCAAVLFTLAAMLALAAALVFLSFSDVLIVWLNQAVKLLAIMLGVCIAVPRGSVRGLASGVLIALIYMSAGYVLYIALGGASFAFSAFLGELLLGVAVGAITGSVRANLPPKRRGYIQKA